MDEELSILEQKKRNDDFDSGKSMADILREKREQTEKILENTKISQQESMEDRKRRLQATRDMLLKQKKNERQQELEDFNGKTKTGDKGDLHKELKDLDSRIKAKETIKKIEENFVIEEGLESTEYDKRLEMYRKLKEQLHGELKNSSQAEQRAKMEEIERKIAAVEKAKKEKQQKDLIQQQALEQARLNQNRGFLSGIKSYTITDD